MNIVILIQLLLAHILADFVLQTNAWVKKKNEGGLKSFAFWSHVVLTGLLTYLILQQWTNWWVPLIIILSHAGTDYWKIEQEKRIKSYNESIKNDDALSGKQKKKKLKSGTAYFFIDQTLHIAVLLIMWLWLDKSFDEIIPFMQKVVSDKEILSITTALIVITWPVGIIIGKITGPFRNELKMNDSLSKAGLYIGTAERILVFVFILIGQYEAIGFLIASKSILRITKDDDKDGRKKTEYVLIGTLISFTIAIVVGLLVKQIIKMP